MTHSTIVRTGGLVVALLALLVATPALADAPTDKADASQAAVDDSDKAFEQMLRGIDTLPDSQALEDRWPDVTQRLADVATDTDASDYKRWRATGFLGEFDEPAAQKAVVELTDDPQPYIRAQAYYVLGTTFVGADDDELFELLVEGLDDDESAVHRRVVLSLGWTDHPRTTEVLEEIAHKDEKLSDYAQRSLDR